MGALISHSKLLGLRYTCLKGLVHSWAFSKGCICRCWPWGSPWEQQKAKSLRASHLACSGAELDPEFAARLFEVLGITVPRGCHGGGGRPSNGVKERGAYSTAQLLLRGCRVSSFGRMMVGRSGCPGCWAGSWWPWAGVKLSSLILLSHPNRTRLSGPKGPEKATWSICYWNPLLSDSCCLIPQGQGIPAVTTHTCSTLSRNVPLLRDPADT